MNRTLAEGKTEQLECHLTTDELLDRANSLALTCQDIEREDGRQSQIKADMKATLSRLEAEQSRLTLIVARKAEPREVGVTIFADDEKAEAITVRNDTGEIIRRRALELSERQTRFADVEPGFEQSAAAYAEERMGQLGGADEPKKGRKKPKADPVADSTCEHGRDIAEPCEQCDGAV